MRKRLTSVEVIVTVLLFAPVALMMAQSGKKTPAETIGTPKSKGAQTIKNPVSVIKEKWPSDVPKLGPLLELEATETIRLPSSFRAMQVRVDTGVKFVALYIGEPDRHFVWVMFYSDEPYGEAFNILPRLKGVVAQSEIRSLRRKIEALQRQSDEKKFLGALSATMDAYRGARDYPTAASVYNGLMFRAAHVLGDDVSLRKFDARSNRIYMKSYRASGKSMCRMWVFNKDGGLLGEVVSPKRRKLVALGIAQSMCHTPEPSDRVPTNRPRTGIRKEPYVGDEVPESTYERLRQIALAVHLYHGEYGKYPESLTDLVAREILAETTLRDAHGEKVQEEVLYVRPSTESDDWGGSPPMMLYEDFESFPEDGLWVGFADGSVSKIESEAEFRDMVFNQSNRKSTSVR